LGGGVDRLFSAFDIGFAPMFPAKAHARHQRPSPTLANDVLVIGGFGGV
jgi:hypothetical protein